jgi:hypothetical protein
VPEVVYVAQVATGVTLFDAALAALVPIALVAVTVNVYEVPVVNPDTVMVPEPAVARVPVTPPGDDVAVYNVIVEPPSLAGAVYVTVAAVGEVTVAVPIVGAPGTLAVVMLFEATLDAPIPAPFVACTENVYEVPPAKPVTLIGDVALVP